MTLRLTPETLAAAYDYLRTTPPFDRWNLPESEDVTFKVFRLAYQGYHAVDARGRHHIGISELAISQTDSLMCCMAHEMVHMIQRETKSDCPKAGHNAAFKKLGVQVCKVHGWDERLFAH